MELGNNLLTLVLFGCLHFVVVSGQTCLNSRHHKPAPSPESNFQECTSWEKNSCCNITISNTIHTHRAKNLYNYHWDKCGTMSQACERFMVDEECFYQCEPKLIEYQINADKGYIGNVPICASFCDRWFEACKDDKTCVEDWLGHWDYDAEDGENHCPAGNECVTFAEMYKDAKGLCDKMWGEAFFYEESDNCMVMKFDKSGENPNSKVTKGAASTIGTISSIKHIGLIIISIFLGILKDI